MTEYPQGSFEESVYDEAGNVVVANDNGDETQYVYNDDNQVVQTTDPDGYITTSLYNAAGNMTETIDGRGNITTMSYDDNGNVVSETDPDHDTTAYVYDKEGNESEVIAPDGGITTMTYNDDGAVVSTENPDGAFTTSLYDHDGNVTETIAEGSSSAIYTTMTYDDADRLVSTKDATGAITTDVYDPDGNVTEIVDPRSTSGSPILTTMTYDGLGRLLTETTPTGAITTDLYDPDGNVTEIVDPRSTSGNPILTTMTYDAGGQLSTETNADGYETQYFYDLNGNLLETIGPADSGNQITANTYDADGRLVGTADAQGNATQYVYDPDGALLETTGPASGEVTTASYDPDGNLLSQTNADGDTTLYAYNVDGNVTEVIDPDGNATTYTYDLAGQQLTATNALGFATTSMYDARGNVTETIDGDGRVDKYSYDNDDRLLTETWFTSTVAAAYATLSYSYDLDGDMLSATITEGGSSQAYTMTYDKDGEVTGVHEPYYSGVNLSFTYDLDGNRTGFYDATQSTYMNSTYGYDAAGLLASRDLYGNFGSGLVASMTVDFTYNGDEQIATETRYDSVATGSDTLVGTTVESYNLDGLVTSIVEDNSSDTQFDEFQYSYNADSEVSLATSALMGGTHTYTYDHAGQLTADNSTTYSYDANGNPDNSGTVIGTNNEMTTDGTWDYSYDGAGNMIEKVSVSTGQTWVYSYNNANELVGVKGYSEGTGSTLEVQTTYTYDAFGNCLQEETWTTVTSAQTTEYAYDGWNPAKAGAPGLSKFAVWLSTNDYYMAGDAPGQVLAEAAGTSGSWLLTDNLGTVRDVVTLTGTLAESIDYDAFGGNQESTSYIMGPQEVQYGFAGQMEDAAAAEIPALASPTTGGLDMYQMGARDYSPQQREWLQQDPAGFAAGDSNLYTYVNNDPTNATDPSGLEADPTPQAPQKTKSTLLTGPTLLPSDTMLKLGSAFFRGLSIMSGIGCTQTSKASPGLSFTQVKDYSTSNGVPIAMLSEIKDAGWPNIIPDPTAVKASLVFGDPITVKLPPWIFNAISTNDKLARAKQGIGQLYNELSSVFVAEVVRTNPKARWITALMEQAAGATYGAKNSFPTTATDNATAWEFVDEAMSEMMDAFVSGSQYLGAYPFKMGGFGSAQHTDQVGNLPPGRFYPSKEFANRALPRYIRNLTLWILQHGSTPPSSGGIAANISALQTFWDTTKEVDDNGRPIAGGELGRYQANPLAYGATPYAYDSQFGTGLKQ